MLPKPLKINQLLKNNSADVIHSKDLIFEGQRPDFAKTQSSGITISTKPFFQPINKYKKRSSRLTTRGSAGQTLQTKQNSPEKTLMDKDVQARIQLYKVTHNIMAEIWPFDKLVNENNNNNNKTNSRGSHDEDLDEGDNDDNKMNIRRDRKLKILNELLQEAQLTQEESQKKTQNKKSLYYDEQDFNNMKIGKLLQESVAHFPVEILRSEAFRVLLSKGSKQIQIKKPIRPVTNNLFTNKPLQSAYTTIQAQSNGNGSGGSNNNNSNIMKRISSSHGLNNTFMTQNGSTNYYHIDKIGYKNYKYCKGNDNNINSSNRSQSSDQLRRTINFANNKKKDNMLETCIQSIYEQKMFMHPEQDVKMTKLFENELIKQKITKKDENNHNYTTTSNNNNFSSTGYGNRSGHGYGNGLNHTYGNGYTNGNNNASLDIIPIRSSLKSSGNTNEFNTNTKFSPEKKKLKSNQDYNNNLDDSFERDQKLIISKNDPKNNTDNNKNNSNNKSQYIPNLTHIIVNKKASFKNKQLHQEFLYYVDLTKKYLQGKRNELTNVSFPDTVLINHKLQIMDKSIKLYFAIYNIQREVMAWKYVVFLLDVKNNRIFFLNSLCRIINHSGAEGILLKIFMENYDLFKNQKKLIVERVLLALGVNLLNKDYEMILWGQYLKFKKILVYKDSSNLEMINFVIKFFVIDESKELEKNEFIGILRMLTDKIDTKLNKGGGNQTLSLFNNFMENFKLAGVISDDTDHVDFDKFRDIYETFKMNILDIIDLISGVV